MKNMVRFVNLDAELVSPINEIASEIGLAVSDDAAICIELARSDSLSISENDSRILLTYTRKNEIFRALSMLPRFLENREAISETPKYSLLSFMADASRNAVPNVESCKRLIRYLALMGYNSLMLYTEDTFELPDYKYFGYMRGKYTEAELREIDDYAYSFGIEVIPCVQTLAHLSTALRWPEFDGYKDVGDTLMVGDERTYKFVRAVLSQCKKCFRSRRINIGMDEAVMLGRGNYLKAHGYKEPAKIMLEHLGRVAEICRELGIHPMMWSDMFFRMSFDGRYYVDEGDMPAEVVDIVPADVDQIYWDYYSIESKRVSHMLECHKKFASNTIFAGGARKWDGISTSNRFSLKSTQMQLDICEEYGVDQIIVTAWGDDGAEASLFSNMSSAMYYSERCYYKDPDKDMMDRRALECFDTSFDDLICFDLPNSHPETALSVNVRITNPGKYLLYNDPLERLLDRHMARETVVDSYRANFERLNRIVDNKNFGYAFKSLAKLCQILIYKADLGWRIYEAYKAGDREAIAKISDSDIPTIMGLLREFTDAFRAQWYKENKTFGFSVQEIRLGGLMERLDSVKQRLDGYVCGEIDKIEELEYEALPIIPSRDGQYIPYNNWRGIVTSNVL